MSRTVRIDIVRPVNPIGLSFVRYCWGAVGARAPEVLRRHKTEFSRLLRILGEAIVRKVGEGALITGTLEFELDDESRPLAARAVSVEVWERRARVEEPVEVRLR